MGRDSTAGEGAAKSRAMPIEDLVLHVRCQARKDINEAAIAEYAEAYRAKVAMPPLEVFEVDGAFYVVDGFHRIRSAHEAGLGFLRVVVVGRGSLDDASWYATGANPGHGVRRTNADKRHAVWMAFENPIGQEQANTVIAEHIRVSDELVRKVRAEWEAAQLPTVGGSEPSLPPTVGGSPEEPVTPKRRGRDGKLRSAPKRGPIKAVDASQPEPPVTDEAALPFEPEYLPPTAIPMPDYGPLLAEAARRVREVRMFVLRSVPKAEELVAMRQRFEGLMRDAQGALDLAVPMLCERGCNGAGCKFCNQAGWLPKGVAAR